MQGKILVREVAEFIYGLTRVPECLGIESIFDWMDNWVFYRKSEKRNSFQPQSRKEHNILPPDSFTETIGRRYELDQMENRGMEQIVIHLFMLFPYEGQQKKEQT